MKKLIAFIGIFLLLNSCSNSEDIEKISELESKVIELEEKITLSNIEDVKNNNIETLDLLKNIQGVDPNNFYYGECMYVHGDEGKIINWEGLSKEKITALNQLFSSFPLTKLDYSKNKNGVSDKIMIGPICNCVEYESLKAKMKELGIIFPNNLFHSAQPFSSCIDIGSSY